MPLHKAVFTVCKTHYHQARKLCLENIFLLINVVEAMNKKKMSLYKLGTTAKQMVLLKHVKFSLFCTETDLV